MQSYPRFKIDALSTRDPVEDLQLAASLEDVKTSGWGIQMFATFRTNCDCLRARRRNR